METNLQEFIRSRRQALYAQVEAINNELAQLDSAEGAITGRVVPTTEGLPTIKNMILAVLAGEPKGLRANDIRPQIKTLYGYNLARESLSPQLTRLKNEGKVTLKGRTWHIA
jgi:hypothetical protein